jgi:ankyrin repeat protein
MTSGWQSQQVCVLRPALRPTTHREVEDRGTPYFVRIPNELKLMFADNLELDDINTLVRTTRALNRLLSPYMYLRAKDQNSRNGRPYFLQAVDAGSLSAVRQFIEVGTSVNTTDTMAPDWATSLHICACYGHIEIARLLIQNGVDLSPVNESGWTPLHYAAVGGDPSSEAMVRLLLDAGADVSGSSQCSDTVLSVATADGTVSIVQLLLERGAIPTIIDQEGDTLLHCAAKHSTGATVRLYLEAGLNIEATNDMGETPLHCAAMYDRKDNIEVLLQWGANVHVFDNGGSTPLQAHFQWKRSDSTAHRILHHETLPGVISWKGSMRCVPVCRFVELDAPVVDLLLSSGANIRARRNSTPSALAEATSWVNDRHDRELVEHR